MARRLRFLPFLVEPTSAASAWMPPSPLLSARRTKVRYLIQTMSVSAQNTSDSTPSTLSCVGTAPCFPTRHSFIA